MNEHDKSMIRRHENTMPVCALSQGGRLLFNGEIYETSKATQGGRRNLHTVTILESIIFRNCLWKRKQVHSNVLLNGVQRMDAASCGAWTFLAVFSQFGALVGLGQSDNPTGPLLSSSDTCWLAEQLALCDAKRQSRSLQFGPKMVHTSIKGKEWQSSLSRAIQHTLIIFNIL